MKFQIFAVILVIAVVAHGRHVRDAITDNTHFNLYTRSNRNIANEIIPNDGSTLGNFDAGKNTKLVLHGFNSNGNTGWMTAIKDAFLDREDVNVILIDWGVLAAGPNYPDAAGNTQPIGNYIATLLNYFTSLGSSSQNYHLIGHSLGAQISGFAGSALGGQVARITGMDPAWPLFENVGNGGRLDASDANFVDVIHTNAGALGAAIQTGHIDFWPNGGKRQAGCYDAFESVPDIETGCSHSRSHDYFLESISNTNSFVSYPCSDYASYASGVCTGCGSGCSNMGYGAQPGQSGQYYLATRINSPYSGKHLFAVLAISNSQQPATGHILLTLNSPSGSDKEEIIQEGGNFKINPGAIYISALAVHGNLQNFNGGSIEFDQEGTEPITTLDIDSLEVWDPATGQRLCTGSVVIPDGSTQSVSFSNC